MSAWPTVPTEEQTLLAVCETLEDAAQSVRRLQETAAHTARALLLVGLAPGASVPENIALPAVQVIAVPATELALTSSAAAVLAPLRARGLADPALRLYQAYLTAQRVVLLVPVPDRASARAWANLLTLTNAYDIRTYPFPQHPPRHGAERALPGAPAARSATTAPDTAGDVSALHLGGPAVVGRAGPAPGLASAPDGGPDVLSLWRSGGELARSATGEGVTAVATRPEP